MKFNGFLGVVSIGLLTFLNCAGSLRANRSTQSCRRIDFQIIRNGRKGRYSCPLKIIPCYCTKCTDQKSLESDEPILRKNCDRNLYTRATNLKLVAGDWWQFWKKKKEKKERDPFKKVSRTWNGCTRDIRGIPKSTSDLPESIRHQGLWNNDRGG